MTNKNCYNLQYLVVYTVITQKNIVEVLQDYDKLYYNQLPHLLSTSMHL